MIDRHGIRLGGAWFPNGLDLSEATIAFPLRCKFCRIAGLQALLLRLDGRRVIRSRWSGGQAALYSLDRLVPAVKLADSGELPPRTRAQRVWSNAQVMAGWLLTLFVVGWLGSLLV